MSHSLSSICLSAQSHDEFVMLEDGFVYYWPNPNYQGALTAQNLRDLANELDTRNAEWNDQINKELSLIENNNEGSQQASNV